MERNISNMPVQKLPMSKKTEEWRRDCVDYFIGISGFSSANSIPDEEELQSYYDLYNSIYNEKDLKYVTNPFNQDDGFPAMAQDYNIIRPKIDLLLGEETKRPFNYNVCRTSDAAAGDIQEKAKQMLLEYAQAAMMAQLGPEEQQRFQQALQTGEIQTPEKIQEYLTKSYKDVAEITAYNSLNFLWKKLNLPHEFEKGFKDALCGGLEFYYVGIRNGDPFAERVNTMDFKYPAEEGIEFVDEASWCVRRIRTSVASLYDDYYDKLDEKQLNHLLELVGQKPTSGYGPDKNSVDDYNHITLNRYNSINGYLEDRVLDDVILYHVCWKSFKKIGFVTILNPETETVEEFEVDETYKETGNEIDIEWKWITETWEGYRTADEGDEDALYFGMQPVEYQFENSSTLNSGKLPYTGVAYSNTNSKAKSLVAIMKPLQYMYIILWYRLELAIARDKGKLPVIDVTQIPKSMGIDVDKWMHYMNALGVVFVNPYEEGWCFAKGTKVLMADGKLRNIENLQLYDKVMSPTGKPTVVTNLFRGDSEMYRITPSIGSDEQIVTADHLVRYIYRTNNGKEEVRLDKAKDLILKFKQNPYYSQRCFLERVSNIDSWNSKPILDPYVLGLWLGDGTTGQPEFESMDSEIVNYLYEYADSHDLKVKCRFNRNSKSNTYYLSSTYNDVNGKNNKNPLIEQLKSLGIYNSKDIPDEYIYTSKENRLKLLAGLIDTDGSISLDRGNHKGFIEFTQCENNKNIVDKFVFIARSLGFRLSVKKIESKLVKIHRNKHYTATQPMYRVRIFDGDFEIPCLVSRKQYTFKNRRCVNKNYTHFTITYEGVSDYYGIAVNNKSHEFLLGDFTIVHNCIPGREGGKPSPYNQWASIDASMANTINTYIGLLDKIEQMVSELSGVSPQRQGAISSNELVGNVERSVVQSAHITEPWFWLHNQVKKRVLSMLLDTSKYAWKDTKKYLHYMQDDVTRVFLQIDDNFCYEDFDIFVSDSTKDNQAIEQLHSLIQPAMQNGASLLDIAEIITLDNLSMIKSKLRDIENNRMQQQQALQEQEAQQQQQLVQMQNEVKEQELMLKEAEMDLEKYKIDQDNATKITVAQLNAYRGSENMDQDMSGVPDPIEIGKQEIERQKAVSDAMTKQMDIANKMRAEDNKKAIEQRKIEAQKEAEKLKATIERERIALEKRKLEEAKKLQILKDKAAMEREKLKAKTALKNKVAGEAKSKTKK